MGEILGSKLTTGGVPAPITLIENGSVPACSFLPICIIFEALIEEKCNSCDFAERRVKDLQVPLAINYKDGNKNNLIKIDYYWVLY